MITTAPASRRILLVSADWRDIFRQDPTEFREKLERDRLEPARNEILSVAWANQSYDERRGNLRGIRRKTALQFAKPLLDLATYFRLPGIVERSGFSPEAVVVYDFGFLPAARRVARRHGATVVLAVNNMPSIYSATRRFGWIKRLYSQLLERLFVGYADQVFTINAAMRDYLLGIGVPAEKISVFAMNTIERDRAHIAAAKRGEVRTRLGIAPGEKLLLTVARLEAEKDYPRLLRAFATLPSNYHLVALGRGSLLPELEALATSLGVRGRVHLEGFVPRDEIWNYYADADAFVLLSTAEALGVVVWEAMHVGVPVVGSEAPGILESIGTDESRGLLFRSERSLEDFPAVIEEAIVGPQRAERLAAAKSYVATAIANPTTVNDIISPPARRVIYLYSRSKDRADFDRIEKREIHDGDLFGLLRLRKLGYKTDLLQIEDIFSANFCKWLRNFISIHFIHIPLILSPQFWRADAVVSGGALGLLVVWALWPFEKPRWVALDFNLAGTIAGKTTIRQKILAWALGKVSGVVCIAEAEIPELLKRVPGIDGRVSFTHEGVDLEFFSPDLSFAKETNLVASVGADRGRDFALAVSAAKSSNINLEIGAPSRHISKLGLFPENISAKMLTHVEVRNLYRRATCAAVILRPTGPADSMGTLAVIEAMASGIPVIATDIPSVRSYIVDGISGILVPVGDEAALVEAFRDLSINSTRATKMGIAARLAAEAKFGADQFALAISKAIWN